MQVISRTRTFGDKMGISSYILDYFKWQKKRGGKMAQDIYKSKKYLELKKKLNWEDTELLIDIVKEAVFAGIESLAEVRKRNKAKTR